VQVCGHAALAPQGQRDLRILNVSLTGTAAGAAEGRRYSMKVTLYRIYPLESHFH
jgi:hypothetical protein